MIFLIINSFLLFGQDTETLDSTRTFGNFGFSSSCGVTDFNPGYTGNENYKLSIYNRWGNKIFETTDKKESWDGTISNQKKNNRAPLGTYFYVVTIDEKDYTGIVEYRD
ncbi:MAG: gliding motility-associated C-terminal domain-containing protein [Flavobacteriales bacterium]|nr:gliding motility-associated C-terminal domain-containing protein [Flavobacteriales bacterium]